MHAPFVGFGPRALDWFRGLEADKSKAYFEANRAPWQAEIRDPRSVWDRSRAVMQWLDTEVGASTLPPEADDRRRR